MTRQEFIEFIKAERRARGLTVDQVAKAAGLGADYYQDIESGQISGGWQIIENILHALDHRLEVTPIEPEYEYRVGDGPWLPYTGQVEARPPLTIYFKAKFKRD